MTEEQLTSLLPLFSTHLGFRALTISSILPFKYLRISWGTYAQTIGKTLTFFIMDRILDLGSEDLESDFSYTLPVLLHTIEMWRDGMAKFSGRKLTGKTSIWEVWGSIVLTYLGWLDPERLLLTTQRVPGTVVDLECQFIKLCYVGRQILMKRRAWGVESQPKNADDFRKSTLAKIAWGTSPLYREPCQRDRTLGFCGHHAISISCG